MTIYEEQQSDYWVWGPATRAVTRHRPTKWRYKYRNGGSMVAMVAKRKHGGHQTLLSARCWSTKEAQWRQMYHPDWDIRITTKLTYCMAMIRRKWLSPSASFQQTLSNQPHRWLHRNEKVARETALVVAEDVEACPQSLQRRPWQLSWRPFRFTVCATFGNMFKV